MMSVNKMTPIHLYTRGGELGKALLKSIPIIACVLLFGAALVFTSCSNGADSGSGESGGGGRIAITQVRATAAPLVLGETIPNGLSYTYTDYLPAGVEGEPAKLIADHAGYGWEKKNGAEWEQVSGQPCTQGIYRVKTQLRIDAPASAQYMLAPDVKVFVSLDGDTAYDEWSVLGIGNYDGFSYAPVISKEYSISDGTPLALSQNNIDIPKSCVGKPISAVNVGDLVSGGTLPYQFYHYFGNASCRTFA